MSERRHRRIRQLARITLLQTGLDVANDTNYVIEPRTTRRRDVRTAFQDREGMPIVLSVYTHTWRRDMCLRSLFQRAKQTYFKEQRTA